MKLGASNNPAARNFRGIGNRVIVRAPFICTMLRTAFSKSAARSEVAAAVRDVESVTSVEVVVVTRSSSGSYRHTDYLVGFAFSFVALLVFLFHPHEFSIDWMPFDSLATFALGALLSSLISTLRRALTSSKLIRDNVRTAARAAFVDLRVTATSARSGFLVFVSLFERRVEVVADIGIDMGVLGPAFAHAVESLAASLRAGDQLPAFLKALRALGPLFAHAYPRLEGDINELPDEPPP